MWLITRLSYIFEVSPLELDEDNKEEMSINDAHTGLRQSTAEERTEVCPPWVNHLICQEGKT